jgi:hypothetical protein
VCVCVCFVVAAESSKPVTFLPTGSLAVSREAC